MTYPQARNVVTADRNSNARPDDDALMARATDLLDLYLALYATAASPLSRRTQISAELSLTATEDELLSLLVDGLRWRQVTMS